MTTVQPSDLERILRNLRRRMSVAGKENLIGIAYGHPMRGGKLDLERGLSICCIVRTKWSSRSAARRGLIPEKLSYRSERKTILSVSQSPSRVVLASDVIEARHFHPTGLTASVAFATHVRELTAGALVTWQIPITKQRIWGILTVGHPFFGVSLGTAVSIQPRGQGTARIGTLLVKAASNDSVDAAIVQIPSDSVADLELADPTIDPTNKSVMTNSALISAADANKVGKTFRFDGGQLFVPIRFHLMSPEIDGLGTIRNVLEVDGLNPAEFESGTSGSYWEVDGRPSCLQFAALPTAFKIGFGQSLLSLRSWAQQTLIGQNLMAAATFQFVRGF